ncbi:MAG: metalloregulator ArsR/SmtB family transcription factor [Rhizomicrobium sp.]|jgi:predicted ArsR family transcriptional regulator
MREKQPFAQSTPKPPAGRAAVLDLLKREGPVASEEMAATLGITAMAVRQHLAGLEGEGLAAYEERAGARGRPAKLWQATPAANGRFADSHSALAADLVVQMRKTFGEEGLDKILKLRTAEQEKIYGARVADKRSLKARLDALARIRSQEGYMADVRRDPETGDWLFVENHCPICAAARLCTGLCREELALFNRVLGSDVRVERVSHILAGASRCAYRVTSA